MARLLKAEEAALRPLLEQEWENVEDLMKALVDALDEARAHTTRYYAVMQFGTEDGKCWYHGFGPFAGRKSAKQAVSRFPGATLASKIAVVPVTSPEALDELLKKGA